MLTFHFLGRFCIASVQVFNPKWIKKSMAIEHPLEKDLDSQKERVDPLWAKIGIEIYLTLLFALLPLHDVLKPSKKGERRPSWK